MHLSDCFAVPISLAYAIRLFLQNKYEYKERIAELSFSQQRDPGIDTTFRKKIACQRTY
jgi:hypothetical protein